MTLVSDKMDTNVFTRMLPCLDCGKGETKPGGFVCIDCHINQAANHQPLWAIVRMGAYGTLSFHIYDCTECGRSLAVLRGIGEMLAAAKIEDTREYICPACKWRANGGALGNKCTWCDGDTDHEIEECPVWDAKLTLTAHNLEQWEESQIKKQLGPMQYQLLEEWAEEEGTTPSEYYRKRINRKNIFSNL